MNFAAMAGKTAGQVTVALANYDVATYLNTYLDYNASTRWRQKWPRRCARF